MILDVSSKYKTPTFFDDRDNIVNFADAFQEEDLNVKNLTFKKEGKNDKIKNENKIIKDEK